jgi:hypothetical protein
LAGRRAPTAVVKEARRGSVWGVEELRQRQGQLRGWVVGVMPSLDRAERWEASNPVGTKMAACGASMEVGYRERK